MKTPQAVDLPQAFRFMGMRGEPDVRMWETARSCEQMLLAMVQPRYVYLVCPVTPAPEGISCAGTTLILRGKDIAAHLSGCSRAVLMCATLSAGADAAIRKASAQDVLRGMMTDALASALTEQVCDAAEREILDTLPGVYSTWRFSPGYGDLPLETQGDFLRAVNAEKRLGVTLSESGLCIPTKTVTAVFGLSGSPVSKGKRGCVICSMAEHCPYRKQGGHCND